MTSYNGERYIKQQIESILSELEENDELIISDDNSTDETVSIINSFIDERIILFRNNYRNHVKNFEFTLVKARGEYIFLSDQDDVWLKGKLNVMLSALQSFDTVISDCWVTDQDLNVISSFFTKDVASLNKNILIRSVIKADNWVGCCMAFRRNIVEKSLPFPRKMYAHDIWLACNSALLGKVKYIPDKFILFRRHNKNVSSTYGEDLVLTRKSNSSLWKKINQRIILITGLMFQFLKKK
jgi:glycosyltransferase involved in cell wall biosynthesis